MKPFSTSLCKQTSSLSFQSQTKLLLHILTLCYFFLNLFSGTQTFCCNSSKQTTFSYSDSVYQESIHITRESINMKYTQFIEHILLLNPYSFVIYICFSNFSNYKQRRREKLEKQNIKMTKQKQQQFKSQISFICAPGATVFHIVMRVHSIY